MTIQELAESISKVVDYEGELVFDKTKPDGTPVKINDVSYLHSLGWKAKVDLLTGIEKTYTWYNNS